MQSRPASQRARALARRSVEAESPWRTCRGGSPENRWIMALGMTPAAPTSSNDVSRLPYVRGRSTLEEARKVRQRWLHNQRPLRRSWRVRDHARPLPSLGTNPLLTPVASQARVTSGGSSGVTCPLLGLGDLGVRDQVRGRAHRQEDLRARAPRQHKRRSLHKAPLLLAPGDTRHSVTRSLCSASDLSLIANRDAGVRLHAVEELHSKRFSLGCWKHRGFGKQLGGHAPPSPGLFVAAPLHRAQPDGASRRRRGESHATSECGSVR